jgi:hypothetical protein
VKDVVELEKLWKKFVLSVVDKKELEKILSLKLISHHELMTEWL